MKIHRKPPKIQARSVLIDATGKIKATGSYSAFKHNPFRHGPAGTWPPVRVSINHRWHTVQVTEYNETWGWVAVGLDEYQAEQDPTPKLEIRGPKV